MVSLIPARRALACTLFVMASYALINGVVLFDYGNWIVGAAGPLIVCALVWGGLTLTNFITEARERARIERERERIRKSFTNYVDPAIVNYLEQHPEKARLDGRKHSPTFERLFRKDGPGRAK
jgi:hypothetical protein